jgi:SAM-dependent methyltransferase
LIVAGILVGMAVAPIWAYGEESADLNDLQLKFDAAYEGGEYRKAIEIAKQMNNIVEPIHVETLCNIARLHCMLGEKIKAYEWLQMAVGAGYWDVRKLREDECFKEFSEENRFRTLARAAWANGYIAMLEREERDEFQKPDEVMKALALKPGERVADIGAGSGYFTVRVAKAVGKTGVVWAIDAMQEMLDYLEKRLDAEQLDNVKLVKVERDDPQLPPGGVDTILLVDTWHYIEDAGGYAKKLREGLAPGGRVVIIDYIPKSWEERPWGPHPRQQRSREKVDEEMAEGGLKPVQVFDFLPEQYFVVYGVE